MKVVINKCYGGFGLSHKAIMLYAKKKGFKLYPFIDKPGSNIDNQLYEPYINQKSVYSIHYSKKPLVKGKYKDSSYFSDDDIKRNDPILVKVVKELGDKANGNYADLVIIEIPEKVEWEIEEYDGIEWVSEKHKTWG